MASRYDKLYYMIFVCITDGLLDMPGSRIRHFTSAILAHHRRFLIPTAAVAVTGRGLQADLQLITEDTLELSAMDT
jgi:hypothetical protein